MTTDFRAMIPTLTFRNQAFINGKYVASASGKTFDCVNPATGQVLTKVAACEQADVDAAVKAARAAFEKGTWANMAPAQRKRIMLKLADLMMKNREELVSLAALDVALKRQMPAPAALKQAHWSDLARGYAFGMHELLAGEPQLIVEMMNGTLGPDSEIDFMEQFIVALKPHGFSAAQAASPTARAPC